MDSGSRGTARAQVPAVICGGVLLAAFGLASILALVLRTLGGAWRFPQVLPAALDGPLATGADTGLLPVAATTAGLAAATALVAVGLVLAAAERLHALPAARQRVGALLFLPLLVPQMGFLFGLQVLLVRLRLDGRLAAVVWSHLVFALPYVWGALAEARASLDARLVLAARTLGAGPARAWWRVTAPLLLRATLLASALGFAVSVALYLPTLFAGAGRIATLATEAAAAMAGGALRSAAAEGAWQAALPLLAFGLAFGLGRSVFRRRQAVPA